MTVRRVTLTGWRNYEDAAVALAPGVNLLCGDNAQGKTNLLEAIAYLSLGRSRRAKSDRELIAHTAQQAALSAVIDGGAREYTIEARLFRGARRRLTINGVPCKSAGELGTVLRTVFFVPGDLALVKDGSAVRRRFLDDALCQLRPRYAAALAEFQRLYAHKTRILRDREEKPSLVDALDDFNLRLCRVGAVLMRYRARLTEGIAARAGALYRDCSGGREEMTVRYRTVGTVSDPLLPAEALVPLLMEHQRTHRDAELAARVCLSGVHKDDLEIEIDGRSARQFASQGQTRTAALCLKLAEREAHYADTGQYPVLLLDDVLSELDPGRQAFVLSRVGGGQVLITCCDPRDAGVGPDAVIQIAGGAVV